MTDFAEADLDQLDLPQAAAVLEGLLLRRWEPRDPRPFKERLISGASWRQEQRAEAYKTPATGYSRRRPPSLSRRSFANSESCPRSRPTFAANQEALNRIWKRYGAASDHCGMRWRSRRQLPSRDGKSTRRRPAIPPQVTDRQRHVLDKLLSIYLEAGDWPTHAYLEQELEDGGIELEP